MNQLAFYEVSIISSCISRQLSFYCCHFSLFFADFASIFPIFELLQLITEDSSLVLLFILAALVITQLNFLILKII